MQPSHSNRQIVEGILSYFLEHLYAHTGRTLSSTEQRAVSRLVDAILDLAAEHLSHPSSSLDSFLAPATTETIRTTRRLSPDEEAELEARNAREFWKQQHARIQRNA